MSWANPGQPQGVRTAVALEDVRTSVLVLLDLAFSMDGEVIVELLHTEVFRSVMHAKWM
ncbi:MAG: hypothetical protein ACP5HZ_09740 [Ferrimicrobium sp.]